MKDFGQNDVTIVALTKSYEKLPNQVHFLSHYHDFSDTAAHQKLE